MRRPLALSFVAVVLTIGVSAAAARDARRSAPLPANATFLITGHGWGHGVGMSQYGAYGYAQHGWTYQKIIAHYFQGTELGTEPAQKIRVLLAAGSSSLKLGSASDFTVRDASGVTHDVAAGTYTLTPALKLRIDQGSKPVSLQQPLLFLPGSSPLSLGRRYRGSIQVDLNSGRLRAINVLGIEQYLYGVVPSEMPYTWAPEALKAQAVAARSYALATKHSGPFDVYPDTRSQVYLGLDHERPSTNAAVDATAAQVALYDGQVAKTYFYSTSGGRTASAQDVWGTAVPYLVSVPDPYDSISPYHNWGPLAFSGARLGRILKAGGTILDAQPTLNSSGRVTTLTVFTARSQRSVSGGTLRQVLGLRSTWFSVGVLALAASRTAVSYGSAARLNGVARGLGQVTLQERTAGVWKPAGTVTPAHDGTVTVGVKPTVTTDYRLASGKVVSGIARVPVAPVVRLIPPRTPTALQGTVRPIVTGAIVSIQREQGTTWSTVAQATLDASGSFDAQLQLTSGTYRARVAPGHGLVAGLSPILQVSTS